ncbi:hypothetical protein DFS33DRAFT_959380 [Desarmillaria ectypa]|nr:hypothetical protein DFS33DRAFT_959380 [Desarmillaria ectypa]
MSRLESRSNPGQDHRAQSSIPSEHHRIFSLCAELSEAASCLPADTPDTIERFCETVLQKLPKDAGGIKRFQTQLFNSLLVDLMPVTLEYKIDPSSVEPPMAQMRRVDDERPGELSTDIDFARIPLLEDVFDLTETSATPFDLTLEAINTNAPSQNQPPFSCCFIPDDRILGGSREVIEVDHNGKFNTRASDEPIHDNGGIRTRTSTRDQFESKSTETDSFPVILATCSAPKLVTAHDEFATSAPVAIATNIVPRTRPRSNTFIMAAPPQLPRTPVSSRYVDPPTSTSSVASSNALSVSTNLCTGTPSDVTINDGSADEEKEQMMSTFAPDPHTPKDQEISPGAASPPKQVANAFVGEHSNKRRRDESADSADHELSHRPHKIRRKSNDGRRN